MDNAVSTEPKTEPRVADSMTMWERAQQRVQEGQAQSRQGSIYRANVPSDEVGQRIPTPPPTAEQLLAEAQRSQAYEVEARRIKREAGTRNMWIGGAICIVGIVVTSISYSAASSEGGGRYIVAWGAILFGAIRFVRGLADSRDNQ
jgi:hypothetical protein